MSRRRKVNQGEKNGRATLTDSQAQDIRSRYKKGRETVDSIWSDYKSKGITLKAIKNICYYQTFNHV